MKNTENDIMMEKIKRVSNTFERDVAFMRWRWMGSVIIVVVLVIALAFSYSSSKFLLLDRQGNVYTSEKVSRTDKSILLIEADAHARNFYGTMWTFDHNNIDAQQKKAAYLGGNVISQLYASLQEKGFYNEVRVNGYYVRSSIDSVDLNTFAYNGNKIYMKIYGSMELSNNAFFELRRLDMEIEMVVVDRIMEKNPNGLSIEALNLLSNETIRKSEN